MPNIQYERKPGDPIVKPMEKEHVDLTELVRAHASKIRVLESKIATLERKLIRTEQEVTALQSKVNRGPRM